MAFMHKHKCILGGVLVHYYIFIILMMGPLKENGMIPRGVWDCYAFAFCILDGYESILHSEAAA